MLESKLHWIQQIEPHRIALSSRSAGFKFLASEIRAWQDAGVSCVVSLLQLHEAQRFGLENEQEICEKKGIRFHLFPIPDHETPKSPEDFSVFVNEILQFVLNGEAVLIHCYAGIGRTEILAASLLSALKVPPHQIFDKLGESRGYEMPETKAQRKWVEEFIETYRNTLQRRCP